MPCASSRCRRFLLRSRCNIGRRVDLRMPEPGSSATTLRLRFKGRAERNERKGHHLSLGAPCLPASPPTTRFCARAMVRSRADLPLRPRVHPRAKAAPARAHPQVRVSRPWAWRWSFRRSVGQRSHVGVLFLGFGAKAEQIEQLAKSWTERLTDCFRQEKHCVILDPRAPVRTFL